MGHHAQMMAVADAEREQLLSRNQYTWVPSMERRAAQHRVESLEVSLARENHARGFAVRASADEEPLPVFTRTEQDFQLDGTGKTNLGDRLARELGSTDSERRVGQL